MIGLIGAIVGLAETVVSFIAENKRNELRNKLLSLKTDLLIEEKKGVVDQDDAKIEMLYSEIKLVVEAIHLEIQLNVAKNQK